MMMMTTTTAKKQELAATTYDKFQSMLLVQVAFPEGAIGISRIAFSTRGHLGGRQADWTQTHGDMCSGLDALYGLYEFVDSSWMPLFERGRKDATK